jgi:cytochrome c oxidase subunit 3
MAAAHAELEHEHGTVWLHEQFEEIPQQNDAYIAGMWAFLITEVMFFGPLFMTYTLYRWRYAEDFYVAHLQTNYLMGAINTTVLLLSSFTMACAVHYAQMQNRKGVMNCLLPTILGAFIFLGIKAFEYQEKFAHGHYPGINFNTPAGSSRAGSQMFFSLYFAMTGLHGIHVVIGIFVLGALFIMWKNRSKMVMEDFAPTEMVGLYWHFVDLVWVFLFPLYYLIPK